ncbi:hypothetical protein GGR57DRAFT_369209 [Xylariaceae sp. FL1272]|nr:hypothetical protein GGR57DRAFT_369209 [Xylariaceae sp. FL1272]
MSSLIRSASSVRLASSMRRKTVPMSRVKSAMNPSKIIASKLLLSRNRTRALYRYTTSADSSKSRTLSNQRLTVSSHLCTVTVVLMLQASADMSSEVKKAIQGMQMLSRYDGNRQEVSEYVSSHLACVVTVAPLESTTVSRKHLAPSEPIRHVRLHRGIHDTPGFSIN